MRVGLKRYRASTAFKRAIMDSVLRVLNFAPPLFSNPGSALVTILKTSAWDSFL